ncbi:hypothetical protein F0562_017114 [Nyssa sinensis]|uniref:Uncharacterized protein n=1 Tax=Nyssa sinensis TaxID=561372 RepID=A0A5J4ZGC7_9ASTE|nr:hypothetical protein F0562_017114 [Nyssa sinensis]
MLHCLRPSSSTETSNLHPVSPPLPGNSAEGTPRSSAQSSPTIDLTDEYNIAIKSSSYNDMWSKIHPSNSSYSDPDTGQGDGHEKQQFLAQFLQPNRECIQEALQQVRPNALTRLVSAYFDHSEKTSHLCHLLQDYVRQAHTLYTPLSELIDVLPQDTDNNSLVQSQCDQAFNIFQEFDLLDNPFPSPNPHFYDMCCCLSQLKEQLDQCLRNSHSRVRRRHHWSHWHRCWCCHIHCSHSCPRTLYNCGRSLPPCITSKITKEELAHQSLLDTAALGTYVLHKHLETIDCLVAGLHTTVEGDKSLIHLGLQMGRNRHPMEEVVKRLRKNHYNFCRQLMDLEEHICRCFIMINRDRSLLLQEIQLHQTHYS